MSTRRHLIGGAIGLTISQVIPPCLFSSDITAEEAELLALCPGCTPRVVLAALRDESPDVRAIIRWFIRASKDQRRWLIAELEALLSQKTDGVR